MIETKKTIENINETTSCFFLRQTKQSNLQLDLQKKRGPHVNKIRYKRGDITTDTTQI